MEYNELGAVMTDTGPVTKVSIDFEVPRPLRIQEIRSWINGGPDSTATFSVGTVLGQEGAPLYYSQTFTVDQVFGAPAKWQGLYSLKWDLQPGIYQFFMAAPDVPLGYGYHGPRPNLDSLLDAFDYRDYSQPDNMPWAPFGLEVYGSFAPVPEPSVYGLAGGAGLLALAAARRLRRKASS